LERLEQLKDVSWVVLVVSQLKIQVTQVLVPMLQLVTLAPLTKPSIREWEGKLSSSQHQLLLVRLHSNLRQIELCRMIWINNLKWNIPILAVTLKTENLDLDFSKVVRPITSY
jgi:hypothetical protein